MLPDLETLLAPVSENPPCGPDLSYDQARLDIEKPFEKSFSIDPTGLTADENETDWNGVINQIVGQLALTKDVWLPVYLCRAGARGGRFEAVTAGGQLLAELLSRYWEQVHPLPDDGDALARKMACDSLGVSSSFVAPLQEIPVLVHPRQGKFSTGDLERLARHGETESDYANFRAALTELGEAPLKDALGLAQVFEQSLRAAEAVFLDKSQGRTVPQFAPTYEALARMRNALSHFLPQPADTGDGAAAAAVPLVGSDQNPAVGAPKQVRSREDVLRVLETVCEYYRSKEPSSPVPLLLERAKLWVSLPFLEILSNIDPEAAPKVRRVVSGPDKT